MYSELYDFMPLLTVLIAFYGGLLVYVVVHYILMGFGIMRVSEALGVRNGWLGFIPYANQYQFGSLSGEIELGNRRMRNPGLWLLLFPILSGVVSGIFSFAIVFGSLGSAMDGIAYADDRAIASMMAGMIWGYFLFFVVVYAMSVFLTIVRMLVYHRIYTCFYDGQRPLFLTLLSAFVPLADGILLIRTAKKPLLRVPPHSLFYMPQAPYGQPYPPYGQAPQGYAGPPPADFGQVPPDGKPPIPPGELGGAQGTSDPEDSEK